jgi:hypothetical protein
MLHDLGLDASPPVRYILKVERSVNCIETRRAEGTPHRVRPYRSYLYEVAQVFEEVEHVPYVAVEAVNFA